MLNKKELEDEQVVIPPILKVPVAYMRAGGFIIRPPYQKGDVVVVVFGERAIDKLTITGEPEEVEFTRQHSYDDAIIVGGLQVEQADDMNSDFAKDLLIENREEDTRWVMKKDGTTFVEKEGAYEVELTPEGEANIDCEEDINVETAGDANIDAAGDVNLQGGDEGIARLGDAIQVEVTSGSSEGVYVGEIIEASEEAFSG